MLYLNESNFINYRFKLMLLHTAKYSVSLDVVYFIYFERQFNYI